MHNLTLNNHNNSPKEVRKNHLSFSMPFGLTKQEYFNQISNFLEPLKSFHSSPKKYLEFCIIFEAENTTKIPNLNTQLLSDLQNDTSFLYKAILEISKITAKYKNRGSIKNIQIVCDKILHYFIILDNFRKQMEWQNQMKVDIQDMLYQYKIDVIFKYKLLKRKELAENDFQKPKKEQEESPTQIMEKKKKFYKIYISEESV